MVVALHPEQSQRGDDQDGTPGCEVEPVSNVVIRSVPAEETPRGDQSSNVAKHDCNNNMSARLSECSGQMCLNQPDEPRCRMLTVCADRCASSCVTHDVCAHLRVREGAEHEGGCGDDESGTVADLRILTGEEHYITDHYKRGGSHDEDLSPVDLGADKRQEQGEEGADDIRGHCVQLLFDYGLLRIDSLHDRRQEEGQALDCDVVEKKDKGRGQGDGAEDAAEDLGLVNLVEDLCLSDTLRLDAGNGEVLFLLSKPAGCLGPVRESEERNEGEADGDDSLDAKDHSPGVQTAKAGKFQDRRREKSTESACQRRHDDV